MTEESGSPEAQLLELLSAFIQADSWNRSEEIVAQHPELLSDLADGLLSQLLETVQQQGDERSAEILARYQTLLRRCREVGTQQAFSELLQGLPDNRTSQLQALLDTLPSNMRSLMAELIDKSSSPEELATSISQHPELAAALNRVPESLSRDPGASGPNRVQEDLARLREYESRTDLSLEQLLREKELVESVLSRISGAEKTQLWAALQGTAGNIYRLAVLPDFRRQSIGTALLREVEGRLVLKGARRISALVEHEDALATSFWTSLSDMGYELDPRMVRYVNNH